MLAYLKKLWNETDEKNGVTIEGVVDWALKYIRIFLCLWLTLFVMGWKLFFRFWRYVYKTLTSGVSKPSWAKSKTETVKAE